MISEHQSLDERSGQEGRKAARGRRRRQEERLLLRYPPRHSYFDLRALAEEDEYPDKNLARRHHTHADGWIDSLLQHSRMQEEAAALLCPMLYVVQANDEKRSAQLVLACLTGLGWENKSFAEACAVSSSSSSCHASKIKPQCFPFDRRLRRRSSD